MRFIKEILPQLPRYRLARAGLAGPGTPINLTFSVTNLCQSRCRTCCIWKLYKENPARRSEELGIHEIREIFRSLGHVFIFNLSGGEPFLRKDLGRIIELACEYLTPRIVHIPTNAIAERLVIERVRKILEIMTDHDPSIQLTIKPSLDHIGKKHDEIRGVPGNYEKVMRVFERLKRLSSKYPSLHAELGTVISRWNIDDIEEIARFAISLGADSYRNEIAEERAEMFNAGNGITPGPDRYRRVVDSFVKLIRSSGAKRSFFQRTTNAFRLIYYDLAVRTMERSKQAVPCYAGISNAHLNPYGEVWPCCTLGYEKSMGNLRDFDCDFKRLWNGEQARQVRDYIRKGKCSCPMANQSYSNMLLHVPSLARVFLEMARI